VNAREENVCTQKAGGKVGRLDVKDKVTISSLLIFSTAQYNLREDLTQIVYFPMKFLRAVKNRVTTGVIHTTS